MRFEEEFPDGPCGKQERPDGVVPRYVVRVSTADGLLTLRMELVTGPELLVYLETPRENDVMVTVYRADEIYSYNGAIIRQKV